MAVLISTPEPNGTTLVLKILSIVSSGARYQTPRPTSGQLWPRTRKQ